MENRGSQWRKWDLHIHTPASDGKGTPKEIVDAAVRKELSVIAITDHHIIDVDRIKSITEIAQDNGIAVLPGIEFLGDARGKKPIHFIGIFPNTDRIGYIWKQIESRTNIKRIEGGAL